MTKVSESPVFSESAFNYVGGLITNLINLFGVRSLDRHILKTFQTISEESLSFPLNTIPRGFSRINHDGTPLQFAITLGKAPHSIFQFLGEAGKPGISGIDRFKKNQACIATITQSLDLNSVYTEIAGLITSMVPETHIELVSDPGGAFWIGVGFSASKIPQLKIYMNNGWGSLNERWKRVENFAAYFGVLDYWQKYIVPIASGLMPMGTALTLKKGASPSGRIYFSAYGKRMSYYEEFSKRGSDKSFQSVLLEFAQLILAEDYSYPTQSAVCSFGLEQDREIDFKFELCGHCIFQSDEQAFLRINHWLNNSSLESSDYKNVLGVLAGGKLSKSVNEFHSFIGVGQKQGSIYSSIYLKPKLYGIAN